MENLQEELLQRWITAFDQLPDLANFKAQVTTTQYSDGFRYNLEKFDWRHFPSDGAMKTAKEDTVAHSLHEYGFNKMGLPCYTSFRHDYNQVDWEGFYSYKDDLVEYVEFCINTGTPSAVERMKFQDGRKTCLQRIVINGRGSGYSLSSIPKDDLIGKISNDGYSIISTVTRYEYNVSGSIEKSYSLHMAPGIGKYTSYDVYSYDSNHQLETIRTFFEQGTSRITYSRIPENMSPELLIETIAVAMADAITTALLKQPPTTPIAILELNYRYADNYTPSLICRSEADVSSQLNNNEFSLVPEYSNIYPVETISFEYIYAQLEQMMEEMDDSNLGSRMLRRTARLLTESKLFGKLQVTDYFTAYAIDWSLEGHSKEEEEEILMECGMTSDIMKKWQQKGML